jgi:hypothetical protein
LGSEHFGGRGGKQVLQHLMATLNPGDEASSLRLPAAYADMRTTPKAHQSGADEAGKRHKLRPEELSRDHAAPSGSC